jgi:competence protein ComEC
MRDPLILPFFALAAGILAARAGGVAPGEAAVAAAAFAILAGLSSKWCSRRFVPIPILFALAAFGALDAGLQTAQPPEPSPVSLETVQTVQGCVVENGVYRDGRLRLKLALQPGAAIYASVAPHGDDPLPPLPLAGTRVSLEGEIRSPRSYRNPGSFDFASYLARQNIFWTVSAKASTYRVLPGSCGPAPAAALGRIRQAGLDALDRIYAGDDYARGMMRGLLLGDGSGIRDVWTQDWRRTGTYHALVISGSQITFVTALLLLWLRVAKSGERTLLVVAALVGWIYSLVCGGSAPVLRAAAGFTLFVGAKFIYRTPRLLNLLAAVAIGFLIIAPDELFDASFQLTFLSVAAMGAIDEPLNARWLRPWQGALGSLSRPELVPKLEPRVAAIRTELLLIAETISAVLRCPLAWVVRTLRMAGGAVLFCLQLMLLSACVQWMLAMPMILYFHRLSITGLTANIIIVPLVSLAIPFGFAAVATGWHFFAAIALWMLKGSQWAATTHARWEPNWRVPDPPLAALVLFCVLLAWFCVALRRQSRWVLPSAVASLAALVLVAAHPFPSSIQRGFLEIAMIDVGQGDSILLGLPSGGAMLVDTGGIQTFGRKTKPRDSSFDTGEDVVSPYLWRRGLRSLDVLMISHAHADHAGGAEAVLNNFHPREVWGAFDVDDKDWRRLAALARAAGSRVRSLHRGEVIQLGGVRWEVFAPLPNLAPRDKNEASLVVRASYGRHALLLTGDMDRRTEALLLEAGYDARADILKVAHHGSKNSSLPRFLDVLKPSLAMISAGYENNFGHPNPVTLNSLDQRHAVVLRTDRQGLVTARSSERWIEAGGHPDGFALPPAWEGY